MKNKGKVYVGIDPIVVDDVQRIFLEVNGLKYNLLLLAGAIEIESPGGIQFEATEDGRLIILSGEAEGVEDA